MRYLVLTIQGAEDRAENVRKMEESISGLEVHMDCNHCGWNNFLGCLRSIKSEGGIIMEDDIRLCKDFTKRIEQAVKENPKAECIRFFDVSKKDHPPIYTNGRSFNWTQCVYYTPKLIRLILAEYKMRAYTKSPIPYLWDRFVGQVLEKNDIPFLNYRPSLVQSRRFGTVNQKHTNKNEWSKFFIDDVIKGTEPERMF